MKNLKKLSVAIMLAALFSTSFTSCIDNEVSPVVEAIYDAQADLLAAQAAVQAAEADLLEAQAQTEAARATLLEAQAQAVADIAAGELAVLMAEAELTAAEAQAVLDEAEGDLANALADAGFTEAETARIIAQTAAAVAVAEENLRALIVANANAEAMAQMALEKAQAQFDAYMAQVAADLEELGAQLALEYALNYRTAMNAANAILSDKLTAEANLAEAELMLTGALGQEVSWAYQLAQLQGTIDNANAAIAVNEAAIADLEAYLADPTTPEAKMSELRENDDRLDALRDEKEMEIEMKQDEMDAIEEADDLLSDVITAYNTLLFVVNTEKDDIATHQATIDAQQLLIDGWLVDIADYPAALTAAEAAVTAAETAETTAQGNVTTAEAALGTETTPAPVAGGTALAGTTLYDLLWNAQLDLADANAAKTVADTALSDLATVIASLEASLNTAAVNLAAKQASVDGGAAAAAVATALGAFNTAVGNLAAADANYVLWRDRFEGGPTVNGGWFWEDPTAPSVNLADDVLGIHTDASGAASDTYVKVNGWTWIDDGDLIPNAADTYEPTTVEVAQVAALPVGPPAGVAILATGSLTFAQYILSDNVIVGGVPYYIEVGQDDVSTENIVAFQAATTALGNEDVYDVPPVAGGTPTGDTGAWADKYNAEIDLLDAQAAEATELQDLADLQKIYDDLKEVYENELTLLDAAQAAVVTAQGVVAAATTAVGTASGNVTAAETALGTETLPAPVAGGTALAGTALYDLLWNAQLAVADAEADLAALESCDPVCLQDKVDAANVIIAENLEDIAEIQIVLDENQAALDVLQVDYDAVVDGQAHNHPPYTYGYWYSAENKAAWFVALHELWVLGQELAALDYEEEINDDMIDVYGGWGADTLEDVQDAIDTLEAGIPALEEAVEKATAALALAQADADADEAYIDYLQALIDTLQGRHENALAIAAEWKALMDAALAS